MSTRFNSLTTQNESARNSAEILRRIDILSKRVVDILVAGFGLIFLSPLFLFIAILIKQDSTGPVFYRGRRLGVNGKLFSILKFRTMFEHPNSYSGPRLTAQDDPRITSIGRLLRNTKINELPQLWNVLIGEMSLVGPRPEDPELAKTWSKEVREELLSIRPGITSPASVLFRNEEAKLHSEQLMENYMGSIMPSKLRLDQLYVRNRSFLLDLDTMLWTFLVLLPRIGAAIPREDRLFWGPMTRLVRWYMKWFAVDSIVTFVAIALVGYNFRLLGPLKIGYPKAIAVALVFALLYSLSCTAFGLNRINWSKAGVGDALIMIPALCIGTIAALSLNVMWIRQPILPIELILVSATVAAIGFVSIRYRDRFIGGLVTRWMQLTGTSTHAQERVLIIGGGDSGQFLAWWMQSNPVGKAFRLVGYVDDDLYKHGSQIHGVDVLGQSNDIPELVAREDIGIILFAIHNISATDQLRLLKICNSTSARLVMVPDIIGSLRTIPKAEHSGRIYVEKSTGAMAAPGSSDSINHFSSPEQICSWLDELGEIAHQGDLQSIQSRINDLSYHIRIFEER